jgi:hypothetical protein
MRKKKRPLAFISKRGAEISSFFQGLVAKGIAIEV